MADLSEAAAEGVLLLEQQTERVVHKTTEAIARGLTEYFKAAGLEELGEDVAKYVRDGLWKR